MEKVLNQIIIDICREIRQFEPDQVRTFINGRALGLILFILPQEPIQSFDDFIFVQFLKYGQTVIFDIAVGCVPFGKEKQSKVDQVFCIFLNAAGRSLCDCGQG